MRVRRTDSTSAWAGIEPFRYDTTGFLVAQPTMIGSPLYEAGVESGDRVTSFDGKKITSEAEWRAALAARKPGEDVAIAFTQRGTRREAKVELATAPWLTIETYEQAGLTTTDAQKAFRAIWLGTKAQ